MWLVFFIFILGLYFSNIEFNLYDIYLSEKRSNYNAKIVFKIFNIFPIFFIYLDKYGIKIFGKKFLYKKRINNKNLKKRNENILKLFFKNNVFELKKFDIFLKIGLIERGLTNIAIVIFSCLFPFYIKKRINKKDFKYKVFPSYDKLVFYLRGNIIISTRTLILIKIYFKNIKSKITHNKSKNYVVKEILKYE